MDAVKKTATLFGYELRIPVVHESALDGFKRHMESVAEDVDNAEDADTLYFWFVKNHLAYHEWCVNH